MDTENKNYFEKLGQAIRESTTLKLLSIFFITILLMIPMSFVQELINERENIRQQTVHEVSNQWANQQYLYGPVLTIPVQKPVVVEGKVQMINDELHILPNQLSINGNITPQKLHRGIYDIVVYDSKLNFTGKFESLANYLVEMDEYKLFPENAFLTIHVSDLRGIKEKVIVRWNDELKNIDPGSKIPSIIKSGFTVKNILNAGDTSAFNFSFELLLQGSQHMGFMPIGKETNVNLSSDWKDPGFSGSFLPDTRQVDKNGFVASWKVLELNRNFPQFWLGNRNMEEINKSSFGVNLMIPVDDYQKAMRTAKYALLAISLTLLSFFLVEIFNKKKVHPFQYVLIGLALCLFYTLLVSISEHLNFNIAYLISSVVIISIIGLYANTILSNVKQVLALVLILCFTYAFVFVTLQIQDYALLIGSIGLTAILTLTMYITRNVNWYNIKNDEG